jgi:predicted ATP-dependent serine protease
VVFIDSLQTTDDGFYADGHMNSMTPGRVIPQFANFCKETYSIGVIIGQVNKAGDFAGKQSIKHMIDCHAHLFIDTKDKSETQGMRIFEMQKNRYGYSGQAYVLNMMENGLYEYGDLNSGD